MLWVEHDMQMVTDLADRIIVLNQGEIIADGFPEYVRKLPLVIEAYLGADAAGPQTLNSAGMQTRFRVKMAGGSAVVQSGR
jgi:branched-chain amino acid transport system ATP-binding protein